MKKSLLAVSVIAALLTGCGGKESAGSYANPTPSVVKDPEPSIISVSPASALVEQKKSTTNSNAVSNTPAIPKGGLSPLPVPSSKKSPAPAPAPTPAPPPAGSGTPAPKLEENKTQVGFKIEEKLGEKDEKGTLVAGLVGLTAGDYLEKKPVDEIFNGKDSATPRIKVDETTGKLILESPSHNGVVAGFNTFDIGLNAFKNKEGKKEFSAIKAYLSSSGDGAVIHLRDPAAAGFQYQTFGQVFNRNGEYEGSISVGQGYSMDPTLTFKATYKGIAMGVYEDRTQTMSDMTAELNWGTDGHRNLVVSLSNTKQSKDNIAKLEYTKIADVSEKSKPIIDKNKQAFNFINNTSFNSPDNKTFNFTETLTWNGSGFASDDDKVTARLYGPKAEEIGGTFDLLIDGDPEQPYQGAFGGKR